MLKTLAFVGGICGAVMLSQYPEFAQQYTQRLAGQVDALSQVVADFDNSALEAGLTRGQALDELTGTAFLDARAVDMRRTFVRHTILSNTLSELRGATSLQLIAMPHRLGDAETLARTWDDFAPAVPVSTAGAVAGAVGFGAGWLAFLALFGWIKLPLLRRDQRTPAIRHDPPLQRVAARPHTETPRLMGETRP